uniref:Uncharacterized protein n=1 Tax=Solanum tuberosum TaxID=4113 RepID=M1DB26_SOLTU
MGKGFRNCLDGEKSPKFEYWDHGFDLGLIELLVQVLSIEITCRSVPNSYSAISVVSLRSSRTIGMFDANDSTCQEQYNIKDPSTSSGKEDKQDIEDKEGKEDKDQTLVLISLLL